MKEKTNKTRWLHIRLSESEHRAISKQYTGSTCRKLSEFARLKLLEKPIITYYRNRSMDDFMAELMKLREDLNAVGNNFNQAVKKLHSLNQTGATGWFITATQKDRDSLLEKTEEIKMSIQKFAERWLQSSNPDHP